MNTDTRWLHRRGELAEGPWESVVDARTPGWQHTGIRVAEIEAGQALQLDGHGVEQLIVPLSGSFSVRWTEGADATTTELTGRASVFAGATDVFYLSVAASAEIAGSGRIAIASAPTAETHPTKRIAADEYPVELRGAGASSREVRNYGIPGVLDAGRLIVCEVITPSGNWSSYPPHKHDEDVPGHESRLEEIYYFEVAPETGIASDDAGFGMFSTYPSPAGDIEIDARVSTGDIALVPYGYHGPAVAAPGYDLYYLNVMAGPDPERAWLISDDPAHAWVRATWENQAVDTRLPFPRTTEGGTR